MKPRIEIVDPQGADAMSLLLEAAIEARSLYPDIHGAEDPWPTNEPTPARGVYLVAYVDELPLGCGALRPLADEPEAAEVRRIFVSAPARRSGLARALMTALEERALEMGYAVLKLETGNRQIPAIRFYESLGYRHIEPFGPYVDDPISVCFAKNLERG